MIMMNINQTSFEARSSKFTFKVNRSDTYRVIQPRIDLER